jgi:hypothetical protein
MRQVINNTLEITAQLLIAAATVVQQHRMLSTGRHGTDSGCSTVSETVY